MKRTLVMALVLVLSATGVRADDRADCQSRNPDRGISGCSKLIESGRLNKKNRFNAYYNRGNAYRKKGQVDRAIADFSRALEIDPRSANAYYMRGYIYYNDKGEPDRAIADYSSAIRINPKFALAYLNRGVAYVRKRDPIPAIADYRKALEINPSLEEAKHNLRSLGQTP